MATSALEVQRRHNENTRDLWDAMSPHRRRVMHEIGRTRAGGRSCVFGAGNCNDLELPRLLSSFDELHLVDIDEAAMRAGIVRQGVESNEKIRLHGGVDFSDLANVDGVLPQADVVVSTCVLSQLIDSVARASSSAGAAKERAVAVRDRHLDVLLRSTAPGGHAILVTDLVSSDTAPELRTCPELQLSKLRDQLIARHNYFHGTNPHAIEQALTSRHGTRLARLERRPPWRWSIGDRVFLVTALVMHRS
ncbi:MAG TPA: hypothetical protein VHC69_20855 [Polyangiaceae bacterium]|nr:hypothetical protein [Polyangiaceae bacterium]